jgi:hypothetical protein
MILEPSVATPTIRNAAGRMAVAGGAVLAAFALVKVVLHVAVNAFSGYGYFRDEFYYLVCAERLALGHVDHPPLIAFLTAAMRGLLGDSLVAIRLLPALAGAGAIVLAGLMARELGGRTFAQALAALAAFIPPVYLATSGILSTIPYDHFLWALCAYLVLRRLTTGDPRYWLGIGAVVGLGLVTKNNFTFLALGLAGGVLLTPVRRDLRGRWLWLGVLIAGLIVAPYLLWQVQHGWPTLEFVRNAAEKNARVDPLDFVLNQILAMHPLTLPIWLTGLIYYLGPWAGGRYRLLGYMYVIPCLLLAATGSARADYLTPAYVMLFAGGAVVIERAYARWRQRWLAPATLAALAVAGVAFLPGSLPVLPPEQLSRFAQAVGLTEASMERGKSAPLPQYFADRFGWEELTATVDRIYRSLPPEEQARAAILTGNYGEAGAIHHFGRRAGLPPTISGHNTYYLWGPGDATGEVAIVVGIRDVDGLRRSFERVEQAATFTCDYCMSYENDMPIYIVRRPTLPIAEAWPQVKHYE